MSDKVKKLLEQEARAITNIPASEEFEKAVDIIHQQVHKLNGKLICSGMGKAGQIANNIATTFSSTVTPSDFLHPADAQHGDLGVLQENDVLLFVSNSGRTREIRELFTLSRRLFNLPVILITGNPEGDLVRDAKAVLFTGNPDEVCPLGLTPTTSTTTMTVIGDILVVMMMEKIGFSADDYSKRHHGGYLGDKSRNTTDTK